MRGSQVTNVSAAASALRRFQTRRARSLAIPDAHGSPPRATACRARAGAIDGIVRIRPIFVLNSRSRRSSISRCGPNRSSVSRIDAGAVERLARALDVRPGERELRDEEQPDGPLRANAAPPRTLPVTTQSRSIASSSSPCFASRRARVMPTRNETALAPDGGIVSLRDSEIRQRVARLSSRVAPSPVALQLLPSRAMERARFDAAFAATNTSPLLNARWMMRAEKRGCFAGSLPRDLRISARLTRIPSLKASRSLRASESAAARRRYDLRERKIPLEEEYPRHDEGRPGSRAGTRVAIVPGQNKEGERRRPPCLPRTGGTVFPAPEALDSWPFPSLPETRQRRIRLVYHRAGGRSISKIPARKLLTRFLPLDTVLAV